MIHYESSLSQSIYDNMRLKETDELVEIWVENDRTEWSDEALSIVRDILRERLGTVPEQQTDSQKKSKRKDKAAVPVWLYIILSPMAALALLFLLVYLFPSVHTTPWFIILFLLSLALFFLLLGLYLGWRVFFKREESRRNMINNLPKTKQYMGLLYFFPDRVIPPYFLITSGLLSIMLIGCGVAVIFLLILILTGQVSIV